MKSRELFTTPTLIVSNYKILGRSDGKYLHQFTPESTLTVYQFIANREPILVEGEKYNIGYRVVNNNNEVDISAVAKAETVNPKVSHYVARELGEQQREVETRKSKERVVYFGKSELYLGKKYAWRIYGEAFPRGVFDSYLHSIDYPRVNCTTDGTPSIAYKDEGLAEAMETLVNSCVRVSKNSNRFKSDLVPDKKWFNIKAIPAITDRK